jgi:mRNA-degrading endonuclease YafQ of YafQ-DinJ toxin-antitoxin module
VSYRLVFTRSYTRRAARFIRRHPELASQYGKVLLLLERDPFHPVLRLHKLRGRLRDLHAVSINVRYRVTLLLLISQADIIPVDIGSHHEVYSG